ncbi:MAG: cytidylate kinase-like family protein, partial [Duncaniella sp.]|nr:cytidylate kinase-like family protein [Duncaniella sp.]
SPDRDKARALAEKTNRLRAEYYNFYTDKTWGDAATYHLTIDSSTLPMDDIADIVIGYVKKKLNAK